MESTEPEAFTKLHFETKRYLKQRASSSSAASAAYHLHGLLSERLGFDAEAVSAFEDAVRLLEIEYEEVETAEVEHKFILANISLARGRIANEDYGAALSALDSALGLLTSGQGEDYPEQAVLTTQCLLLKALACFWSDSVQECLEAFEEARSALEKVPPDTDEERVKTKFATQTALLLSRVLYALGEDEQIEEAERQLLNKYVVRPRYVLILAS